jgi:tetratricopeptide (TPR) repeat protein
MGRSLVQDVTTNLQRMAAEASRHYRAGNFPDADRLCRDMLRIDALHADSLHLLGVMAYQTGRHEAARDLIVKAIMVDGGMASYHSNLGNALRGLGMFEAAESAYRRALEIAPEHAEIHNNLGNALTDLERLTDAEHSYRRALDIRPDHVGAHCNLGIALKNLGRFDEAISFCHQALALAPDLAEAFNNLGNCHNDLGHLDSADRCYRRAVALVPGNAAFHFSLAENKHFAPDDPQLALMEVLTQTIDPLPQRDSIYLHFALGKAYDDIGQKQRAFHHLLAGNRLKRQVTAYNENEALSLFDRIPPAFAKNATLESKNPADGPIFIVGMPRSGTTLLEQILASHRQVIGGGESTLLEQAIFAIIDKAAFPEAFAQLSDEDCRKIAEQYLSGRRKSRLTDKTPDNFLYCGVIARALPNARIIHIRRDPVDTCLSCFSKLFSLGQDYSYDLAELGNYYRAYRSLMAHWRDILPAGFMLELNYEDLVADPEGQTRRLLDFCGLEWDPACLDFHTTRRAVSTASVRQVRQPIYRTSVGRWRPEPALLKPLIDALADFPSS